ncbi:MAG TPA: hypothetical protein VEB59_02470 [Gemmatimonadales bacterium]|nr:hypothetical protein [Gemmatimonadales bacterium]
MTPSIVADGFARPLSLEEIEGGQAELQAREAARVQQYLDQTPEPRNLALALSLGEAEVLQFRNRVFRVPPVPYPSGLRLQAILRRLERLKGLPEDEAMLTELLGLLHEAVQLFHSLVRPATLWDRLFWRLRANPFLHATETEVGELLGFFSVCRTSSSVRPPNATPAVRSPSLTSPTTSRPSFSVSAGRRGWDRTAIRAPGGTSGWGPM